MKNIRILSVLLGGALLLAGCSQKSLFLNYEQSPAHETKPLPLSSINPSYSNTERVEFHEAHLGLETQLGGGRRGSDFPVSVRLYGGMLRLEDENSDTLTGSGLNSGLDLALGAGQFVSLYAGKRHTQLYEVVVTDPGSPTENRFDGYMDTTVRGGALQLGVVRLFVHNREYALKMGSFEKSGLKQTNSFGREFNWKWGR